MIARRPHPSLEEWTRWLVGDELDEGRNEELREHLDGCERCQKDVALLGSVKRARKVRRWETPPEHLRKLARQASREKLSPAAPHRSRNVRWAPADVRGTGLVSAGGSRMISRVFDQAELGIVAIPPKGDGTWRIEGRVWLRESDERPIRALLVHGEHVVHSIEIDDGQYFQIEEVVGSGWMLELHLPTGETITLEDPDA